MNPILLFAGWLLAGILLSLPVQAQQISGTIRDSTGSPVAYASVNLRNRTGDAIVAYTTTDARGTYVLRLPAGLRADTLYLEVRCIGYKTQSRMLSGSAPTE